MKIINTAVIGLGKMGLSHAAILGGNKNVNLTAICDTSNIVLSAFKKYNPSVNVYKDYIKLFDNEELDAVVIATPTKLHHKMAVEAMNRGIHVFCEKPFALTYAQGQEMVKLANENSIINQVGYHNHFIGTFREMKRLLKLNILGKQYHFTGEAFGPVITKPKGGNWRANPAEGGGCLYDYASHVINLIQEIIGKPLEARGTLLKKFYSKNVEDGVFSSLVLDNGISGNLSVNWSDETYRKMSTSLMVFGEKGKIICDATEIKIYLKEENKSENLNKGWTIKYITDLAIPVDFYLRGEEYSAQLDYFIENVVSKIQGDVNNFKQALYTDKVINLLINDNL
jgi:predicted dehydrogenase